MTRRVFVTGATGYLGSAIAARLARAGCEVQGLTRTPEGARALEALGVQPVIGDLAAAPGWLGAMQHCDAVVHAAFDERGGASDQDHHALEAVRLAALDGRVRHLLYTSSVWVFGATGDAPADERSPLKPFEQAAWRAGHETLALGLAANEVSVVVLRPGMVYGEHRGVLGGWFAEAQVRHVVTYPGDGSQRWPMVHRDDVAEAYALALEHAEGGACYVLADESRHTVREMAEAVAAAAGATAQAWPADEVVKTLGLYGKALLADQTVTSAKARRELGWVPRHTSVVSEAGALWREWLDARAATVR